MSQRSDLPLIRGLLAPDAEGGHVPKAWVESWQRAPYFDVREDIAMSYAGDEDALNAPVGGPDKPLPYDDFVIHPTLNTFARPAYHGFSLYARVVAAPLMRRLFVDEHSYAKATALFENQAEWHKVGVRELTFHAFACVLVVIDDPDTPRRWIIPGPVYIGLAANERGRFVSMNTAIGGWNADAEGVRQSKELAEMAVTAINNTVGYIMRSPKHIVETRTSAPRCSPKTGKLKPWLRDDLPSLVFMGPDDALRAGQPRVGNNPEGEGRQKRPHSRRAHWRRLGVDSDGTIRKTFVRACWVGPDEWDHQGRQYRVLRARDE